MKKILLPALMLVVAAGANAQFVESEPNDTAATADSIARGATPWSQIGLLSFNVAGDNDWFVISLTAGETITAITTPMESQFVAPDTVMAFVDPTATTVLVSNDDIGGASNRGSGWAYTVSTAGDYYIAVTGFHTGSQSDIGFYTGSHAEEGRYTLMVGIVPEPASMIALAMGAGALLARRRRRA